MAKSRGAVGGGTPPNVNMNGLGGPSKPNYGNLAPRGSITPVAPGGGFGAGGFGKTVGKPNKAGAGSSGLMHPGPDRC